jgi:hypothetical protein
MTTLDLSNVRPVEATTKFIRTESSPKTPAAYAGTLIAPKGVTNRGWMKVQWQVTIDIH